MISILSPAHAFKTEGMKSVSLSVTDGEGRTSTASIIVSIFAAPSGVAPPDFFMFPMPPTPAPVATGLAGPGPFAAATVTSIEMCHGRPMTQYLIRFRLVDPGVRVQIIKCTVYVLHPCTAANK